jgi:hypothetical protein
MICFAWPVLAEDLFIVQKKEFSITYYIYGTYTGQKANIFIGNKPNLS